MIKKVVLSGSVLIGFAVLVPGIFGVYYYLDLIRDVRMEMQNGVIDRAADSESYVYYDDQTSVLGVFFDKVHQSHIAFNEIPDLFIKALIAVEDRTFYQHHGIDVSAVFRAAASNFRSGKIVQGGSTITQQTAKNLFPRQKRSYAAKIRELIQAAYLEKTYTKEEILELYANQFYVAGMGRGIGVAAQYYFNKEVKDLDLVEAAFIAGSIKGPGKYNPFTKKTDQARQAALENARERKDHVLQSMLDMKYITEDQYIQNAGEEIPFRKGKISYDLSSVMDYIRKQLQSDWFREVLEDHGIDNIATSGIRIHTSINRQIQEGMIQSLRRHLSSVDTMLAGYDREQLNRRYDALSNAELNTLKTSNIHIGRIKTIDKNEAYPHMVVVPDNGEEVILDIAGMEDLCNAWIKSRYGVWAEVEPGYILSFLDQFQPGDRVAVQFTAQHPDTGPTLMLAKVPELQGGVIVLHDGMITAMAGGYYNHYWNRSVDSKRQLGSIFKPIVYTAALQLKWHLLDPLSNVKELYRFEKTAYFPMPDHDPVARRVSMVWAGAKSENLASVWLLYSLTDKLDSDEFALLAEMVGLGKQTDESDVAYIQRIRDQWGILYNDETLLESAFQEAREKLENALETAGKDDLIQILKFLRYDLKTKGLSADYPELKQCPFSFKEFQSLNLAMKKNIAMLEAVMQDAVNSATTVKQISDLMKSHYYLTCDPVPGNPCLVYAPLNVAAITAPVRRPVSPEWLINNFNRIDTEHILIQGLIPSGIVDRMQADIDARYKTLKDQVKSHDPTFLHRLRDFRTLTGMLYVTQFSKRIGVAGQLEPVLSFPLGANAVSIAEMAVAYQTMMTTKVFPFADSNSPDMIPIITKIVDRKGATIWAYHPKPEKKISQRVSRLCREILKMTIEKGTGQGAKDTVRIQMRSNDPVSDISVPVCGKTGTSNNYMNSSFVGYIPEPISKSRDDEESRGYIITSYVGYDDNRPMKGKKVIIYGSSGALPIWIDSAIAVVNSVKYNQGIPKDRPLIFESPAASSEYPLQPVMISLVDGLPVTPRETDEGPDIPSYVWADVETNDSSGFILKREFEPFILETQED